jgi:hypothetical protein
MVETPDPWPLRHLVLRTPRLELRPDDWHLNLLIRFDGKVIGNQGVYAKNFAILNEVSTGSWIGRRHQDSGIGTEMRAAVLMFAFDHLGAHGKIVGLHRQQAVERSERAPGLRTGRQLHGCPQRNQSHPNKAATNSGALRAVSTTLAPGTKGNHGSGPLLGVA